MGNGGGVRATRPLKENSIDATMRRLMTTIHSSDIEHIYAGLNGIGRSGPGYDRSAWSAAESEAMRFIAERSEVDGLNVRWDAVGNLIVEVPGEFESWVETGSHIDSVPGGGNYDGVAGVVAGLAVLIALHRRGDRLERGVRLRIWRGEESASFGITSKGSRAAFGMLPAESLSASHEGVSLADAIRGQGFDTTPIEQGIATIRGSERDSIAAHIELHIEQGKVLESEGIDIGIVTGIRGSMRSRAIIRGRFDHSGATPMGIEYRRDANLAIAHMQVRLDALAKNAIANGADIVQTVGVVNGPEMAERFPELGDNAVSKVSGFGCFTHEVRGIDGDAVGDFVSEAKRMIKVTADEFGVNVDIETFSTVDGIGSLDLEIRNRIAKACERVGASYREMPSGAWHDAGVVCSAVRGGGSSIPTGMIFIPCRNGISHSPDEYASPEQIALGANVLLEMMLSV